jgi:RNA polymerase sigma-70 factor, ECF subfamily
MTVDVADLVTAAQGGDRRAFDELVRSTYTDTYTLARRLTGNEEDARDVVQDAYLRAYKSLDKFRGDAKFQTWMYRITANCASTFLSKKSKRRTEELNDEITPVIDDHPDHDPERKADSSIEHVRINAALEALPASLRQVVVLRDIYDLPHEEIAKQLGITEASAKVRLHRARKKLRERLYPLPGEESAHAV